MFFFIKNRKSDADVGREDEGFFPAFFCDYNMEDGVLDRTIIAWRQNQLGQMADFPPLLTFLNF